MLTNYLLSCPHRRYNPLKDEWILVSPQRTARPWIGRQEQHPQGKIAIYDPSCYLCPGNKRAAGRINPRYKNTYVFDNDFPSILENKPSIDKTSYLLQTEIVDGKCRVMCFSPKHNLTLSQMPVEDIELVINTWIKEVGVLGKKYAWTQIFENKGEIMGCSNPHPHCQIWAGNFLPTELEKEDREQRKYFQKNKSPLLADYLLQEQKMKERIVATNKHWTVLVPFWATWPYETMILPARTITSLLLITPQQVCALSEIMKTLLTSYDNLFDISMPYSMGWHFAPFDNKKNPHWQLHAHFYPPLLRSAAVKKFMVGYEMLSEPQRDITPEAAAEKLRSLCTR